MRLRSRILLTAGLACLSTAMLAGGALAHGGDGHKGKFGKFSKRGHAALKVEVRGAITALTTRSRSPCSAVWPRRLPRSRPGRRTPAAVARPRSLGTCYIPAGSTVTGFVVGDIVKLSCKSADGKLVAYRLRAAGKHLPKATRTEATAAVRGFWRGGPGPWRRLGDHPRVHHRRPRHRRRGRHAPERDLRDRQAHPLLRHDLPRRHRQDRVQEQERRRSSPRGSRRRARQDRPDQGRGQVEGGYDSTRPASASRAARPCAVADATLLTGIAVGDFVEAKCAGNPLTLTKIHLED